jgi:hypothetical protein
MEFKVGETILLKVNGEHWIICEVVGISPNDIYITTPAPYGVFYHIGNEGYYGLILNKDRYIKIKDINIL